LIASHTHPEIPHKCESCAPHPSRTGGADAFEKKDQDLGPPEILPRPLLLPGWVPARHPPPGAFKRSLPRRGAPGSGPYGAIHKWHAAARVVR